MSQWLQWTLIIAGILVIGLLGHFIWQRSRRIRQQQAAEKKNQSFRDERRAKMIESIQVLAMGLEQNQVEYSEACLRIKGLLDHVAPELLSQSPYRIFQEMHDHIDHMPTHEARQETDPQFIRKLDEQRFALEREHSDSIRRAATAIRHHSF